MSTDAGENTSPLFCVEHLQVRPAEHGASAATDHVLRGLDLTVEAGETHAIIGSSGSGKSALGAALMGSPRYEVTSGSVNVLGDDVTDWPADERAKAGMFLGFESPVEVAGVSMIRLLHRARSARPGSDLSVSDLRVAATDWIARLDLDPSVLDRHVDEGFTNSHEIMQMALLEPRLAILDEPGAGRGHDALRTAASQINEVRREHTEMGMLLITEHQRLIDEVSPDHIHVLVDGRIVETRGPESAERLRRGGYETFESTASLSIAS